MSSESGIDGNINSEVRIPNSELSTPFAYQDGDHLVITATGTLQAFDVMGRMVFKTEIHNSKYEVQNSAFPGTGVYLLSLAGRTQRVVVISE